MAVYRARPDYGLPRGFQVRPVHACSSQVPHRALHIPACGQARRLGEEACQAPGRVKENFRKEAGSVETDRLIKAPWRGSESYRSREEVRMFWAQGLIPLSHEGYL